MVVWRARDYHGTTLPHCSPKRLNTDFHQVGLSIAISGGMGRVVLGGAKKDVASRRNGQEVGLGSGYGIIVKFGYGIWSWTFIFIDLFER